MKKHFIALIMSVLYTNIIIAQNYPVAAIPDSLKQNVHSVVRLYEETFTVVNIGEASHKIHSVTTVLDTRGQQNATVNVFHDKHIKVINMEAAVYDAAGKEVKKMKRSDINDINYVSDVSLFEDNKIKHADLKYSLYPYTVEVSYEIRTINLMFYPRWYPQAASNTSVEKSQFSISVPPASGLRYKLLNGMVEPIKTDETNGNKTYTWVVKNKKFVTPEELSPQMANVGPAVLTAPTDFELEGRKGNMKTWKDLGLFHYELNKDRDALPDNIKTEIVTLVKGLTNPAQKIKKIYEYLQAHTRYVSVQLGIGGWQTFEAKTVAEKGYGDCKALSNYTKALLKEAGIEAFQALVDADEPDQFLDFPMANFNHVILCVPQPKDSIWLECTSQSNAFGYLGDFTGDRHALLLTPTGGVLVKTPTYQPTDNRQFRNIQIRLDETGDATATVKTHFSGLQQDVRSHVIDISPADQKEWLYKRIKLPSFEISKWSYSQQKDKIPVVTENLELLVRQLASKSGNRMFVNPNLMTMWSTNLNPNLKRKNDIEWASGFLDMDTVSVAIPSNFKIEYAPAPLKIETKYGSYEITTTIKEDKVYYYRKMLMFKGLYSANQYAEVADFFKKIAKADKNQIVCIKKE